MYFCHENYISGVYSWFLLGGSIFAVLGTTAYLMFSFIVLDMYVIHIFIYHEVYV